MIRIDIHELVKTGSWTRFFKQTRVDLIHTGNIKLLVNNIVQPVEWEIFEYYPKLRPRNGGYVPFGKACINYLQGKDGGHYRHLYIAYTPSSEAFRIGTWKDFGGALYASSARSKKQRKLTQEVLLISLPKRKRERKVKWRAELKQRHKEKKEDEQLFRPEFFHTP